ncbi:MAG: cytochrome c oxidase subunit 4 [Firmicutes bacterium]|nr:cytochrome c oxidase subunit 4 [Bacillota bacterium]
MKDEGRLLLVIAVFGAIIATVYWFTGYEDGGTVMLVGTSLLGLMPASYYLWWSRRMKPRPEDDPNASPAEGSGVIGAFPHSSIWPFVFGLGAAMVGLALVFGVWTAIFGIVLGITAVLGIISESRRGGNI